MSTDLPAPRGATTPETIEGLPATARPYPTLDSPGERPPQGLDWRRVMGAVRRFRWLLVLGALSGTMAGLAATRIIPPQFGAQATIWIESGAPRGTDRGPIRPDRLLESDAWVELLKSYVVMDEVVRQLGLFLTHESPADSVAFEGFGLDRHYRPGDYDLAVDPSGETYLLSTSDGIPLERGVVGDSVGRSVGFLWAPRASAVRSGRTARFSVATLRDAARGLAEMIEVKMDLNGNFMRLQLRGADPIRVAAIVNTVAERYVAVAADLKRQKLTELTRILEDQLGVAQRNLQGAESALEGFRVRTITLPSERGSPAAPERTETADPVFASFFDMKVEREQLRRDREAVERELARADDSGISADGLGVIPSVQRATALPQALRELTTKQAELRALGYRYADAYPPARRLAEEIGLLERETVPALARTLVGEIASREAVLDARLGSASRDLQQIPARAIEEGRLRRAVTVSEDLHTTLQQRYEEARLAEASSVPDVRVLDAAVVSRRPMKSTAMRLIVLGLLAGLGAALATAVLLDRMDPRVRYPEQVSREMGLPILGTIPHIRVPPGRQQPTEADAVEVLEALRGIRLSLTSAHGTAGPWLLTITSPGPGDGKSFLSANLARAFAARGHPTLLLDADLRRGSLHRRLALRRTPGLSDYLAGQVDADVIVQHTSHDSLWFIGSGGRPKNGAELLESPAMASLFARLRATYEVIICDSPPLGAGVDPYVLSMLTGNLLLVLRAGVSHRQVAEMNLALLGRLPVRLLGAVLNDVPAWGVYRYYPYAPNYADAEPEVVARGVIRSGRA